MVKGGTLASSDLMLCCCSLLISSWATTPGAVNLLPGPQRPSRLRSFAGAVLTKRHTLSGLNSRNVWSHSSGGWKFKIKGSAGLVAPEGSLWACRRPPSPCVLTWPFLCACHPWCLSVCPNFLFYDTSQTGLEPTLPASF